MPTTTGMEMLRSWLGEEDSDVEVVAADGEEAKRAERTVKTHWVKMGLVESVTAGNPRRNLHNSSSFLEIYFFNEFEIELV